MPDKRLFLSKPPVGTFSIKDAIKYSGYTSNSLVAYVNEEINFITPGANFDYIQRVPWDKLLPEVVEIINQYGKNAAFELHKRHKDAISTYTSAFVN